MQIAAIDIGTNSIHMVIARATGARGFEVLDRERDVVQIGRDSFQNGRLRSDAIRRTVEALGRYAELARRHQVDAILCTATAAVREAKNGGEFLQAARAASGVLPRVIPAEEEGRLIWLAVQSALVLDENPALVVDIGGGSMQLVVGNRDRIAYSGSAPLGALRLTQSYLQSDPPARGELQRLRRQIRKHARGALAAVAKLKPLTVYGSSGSIHALAEAAHWLDHETRLGQINGHFLSTESLSGLTRRLQRMTQAERERLPGIDAHRAEIIVPGAMVLTHVLESLGADGILLSDYGVREGLVTDYLLSHPRERTTLEQVDSLKMRGVLQLLTRFPLNEPHARHVAKLALALFDGLRSFHQLGPEERELLHFAALLHDIGAVLGYDNHGEHSYYMIKNGNLRGLTGEEVELVASIARYHGAARPRKKDAAVRAMSKRSRLVLRWLAAILRIAEGLDRSRYQLVRALRVVRRQGRVSIRLATRRDARLEIWAARRRTALLERMLGMKVRVGAVGSRPPAAPGEKRPAPGPRSGSVSRELS